MSLVLKDIAMACIAHLLFEPNRSDPNASDSQVSTNEQLNENYAQSEEIPMLVEEQYFSDIRQRIPQQNEQLWDLFEQSLQTPHSDDIPLLNVAHHYKLNWLEILTVALCVAVEKEAMAGRALVYVQSPVAGSRPALGLLEAALKPFLKLQPLKLQAQKPQSTKQDSAISISSSLLSGRAMEIGLIKSLDNSLPIPEQTLLVPQSVVLTLQGSWRMIGGTSLLESPSRVLLSESIIRGANQQAGVLLNSHHRALIIRTASLPEANSIVQYIAGQLHKIPLCIYETVNEAEPLGLLCVIANLLPVFQFTSISLEHQLLPELYAYDGPIIVITGPDAIIRSDNYSIMNWLVPIPDASERLKIWLHYLSDEPLARLLAKDHLQSCGRIAELAELSQREAEMRQHEGQCLDDIHNASWSQSNDDLSTLADAVTNRISDDALILMPETKLELQLLLQRCRNRETLVNELGVSFQVRYQPGVRCLFTGPSGTGKTLAAAWLATRLAMPIYRVDLSSVLSKYIGETEKNLASLLAKAERSGVILLFDEADSLFGKRTDIKDSNDRYANTQTNYLLQRIENYQGIVLLTSNSRSRFDSAFTRRIDLIIDFPRPGPHERRALWYSHLGNKHELSAAKINQLAATLDICGGHIRNVVLSASVSAHEEHRLITFQDVLQGLKLEYKKLAKKLPVDLLRE